jgi:hypothetical protein
VLPAQPRVVELARGLPAAHRVSARPGHRNLAPEPGSARRHFAGSVYTRQYYGDGFVLVTLAMEKEWNRGCLHQTKSSGKSLRCTCLALPAFRWLDDPRERAVHRLIDSSPNKRGLHCLSVLLTDPSDRMGQRCMTPPPSVTEHTDGG